MTAWDSEIAVTYWLQVPEASVCYWCASRRCSTFSSLNPSYDCPHFDTIQLHARAPANVCARELKKTSWRGDAIAGNIKLFAWAGFWIKTLRQKKKRKANLEMWSGKCSLPPLRRHVLLCFSLNLMIIFWMIFDFQDVSADPIILCTSQCASSTQSFRWRNHLHVRLR